MVAISYDAVFPAFEWLATMDMCGGGVGLSCTCRSCDQSSAYRKSLLRVVSGRHYCSERGLFHG